MVQKTEHGYDKAKHESRSSSQFFAGESNVAVQPEAFVTSILVPVHEDVPISGEISVMLSRLLQKEIERAVSKLNSTEAAVTKTKTVASK